MQIWLQLLTLSLTDADGSVILRPCNTYAYRFGFELPREGYVESLVLSNDMNIITLNTSDLLILMVRSSFSHRQLVSSYKGKFGSIQYYVKASMERPGQPALESKKNFEVEEPLDVCTPDLLVS